MKNIFTVFPGPFLPLLLWSLFVYLKLDLQTFCRIPIDPLKWVIKETPANYHAHTCYLGSMVNLVQICHFSWVEYIVAIPEPGFFHPLGSCHWCKQVLVKAKKAKIKPVLNWYLCIYVTAKKLSVSGPITKRIGIFRKEI